MPKSKQQKQEFLEKIQAKIALSKAAVLSSDNGLNVKTVENLRKALKAQNGEYLVAKKTLLKKALGDLGNNEALDNLSGSVGIALSYEDELVPASILSKFAKENTTLTIGGGILENKFILADMVKKLASLPSKEVMLGKLVGTLQAPISGFVGALSGNLRNLVGVLNAIKEKK